MRSMERRRQMTRMRVFSGDSLKEIDQHKSEREGVKGEAHFTSPSLSVSLIIKPKSLISLKQRQK